MGNYRKFEDKKIAKNQFWLNKRRGHYAYIYAVKDEKVNNILISTKPFVEQTQHGKKKLIANEELDHHPNPNYSGPAWLMKRRYVDGPNAFTGRPYKKWKFSSKKDCETARRIINRK